MSSVNICSINKWFLDSVCYKPSSSYVTALLTFLLHLSKPVTKFIEHLVFSICRDTVQCHEEYLARLQEICLYPVTNMGFPSGSAIKNLPAMQEIQVQSLVWEKPLEKEMATHCSILAWRIPWTEEPDALQSTGSKRVRQDGSDWTHKHKCINCFVSFSAKITSATV